MVKTERLRRSFFPQAIRLLNSNSGLITSTWLHLIISKIFIILHPSILLLCKYPVQPVCTFFLHNAAYIMYYVLSLQYTLLHILFFLFFSYLYLCILSWVCVTYNRTVHGAALHFTAGYILYNCVCDEYKSWYTMYVPGESALIYPPTMTFPLWLSCCSISSCQFLQLCTIAGSMHIRACRRKVSYLNRCIFIAANTRQQREVAKQYNCKFCNLWHYRFFVFL